MNVHKLANILYYHIHPNFSRKSLLCPCMARKLTDNSWTIHHSQKCGEKTPKYPLTNKWIIKLIYPYSESENEIRSVVSDSLWPHELYSLWNSPGHNTGVGSLSLLQGIFPTQGLNPGLPHCRRFSTSWATREAQETIRVTIPVFRVVLSYLVVSDSLGPHGL